MDYQYIIKEKYQNMIRNIGTYKWSNPSASPYRLPTLEQYISERGSVIGQNGIPTTWTGKIGLIYASDYVYISTDEDCRKDLRAGLTLNENQINFSNSKCKNNN